MYITLPVLVLSRANKANLRSLDMKEVNTGNKLSY